MKRVASLAMMLAMTLSCAAEQEPKQGNAGIVQAFVAAYNARQIDKMLSLVTPTVRWHAVEGQSVETMTDGIDDLREAMAADFSGGSTTRSTLLSTAQDGPMVTAIERAEWSVGEEHWAQCSASVYRFEQGLIAEIWYFPAHACSESASPD